MFCQKCGTKNPENGRFCRACGSDLTTATEPRAIEIKPNDFYIDRRGRVRSNNPDDLWSAGLKNTVMGVGFLIISLALLLTNVAGGKNWWWAMLFPAFSLIASGIGSFAKSKRLERKNAATIENIPAQPILQQPKNPAFLSEPSNEYAMPKKSIYDTGDLVAPPSVTENTTRHLEINQEGETMTLPKK